MLSNPNLKQHRRKGIRASILQVLNVGRPWGTSETLIEDAIAGTEEYGHLVPGELRREIDYLADLGFVVVKDREATVWLCELTPAGVDLVEGVTKPPPGIARIRFE